MRKIRMAMLTVALLVLLGHTVLATGTVTYVGQADGFVFAPGSDTSLTDLFSNMKNVMPGDVRTQRIVVKNDAANGTKVRLYIRALGAQEGSEALLSQFHLRVAVAEDAQMAYMFDAAANETDGMTDWILLGTLYSGGTVELDVTLEVPFTLDNAFQDAVGYLDWQFMAEELPVADTDPKPPQTGDTVSVWQITAVVVLCVIGLGLLADGKMRRKR